MGLHDQKESRNKLPNKTQTRSSLPHAQQPATKRFSHKPKTNSRRKSEKSIHHNKRRQRVPSKLLRHTQGATGRQRPQIVTSLYPTCKFTCESGANDVAPRKNINMSQVYTLKNALSILFRVTERGQRYG
jgi:hypothetical protein